MKELIKELINSSYVCAFTGAGMDTESHLPDFRGPDGLWKNHDPRRLASTDALRDHYPLFHEFYRHRLHQLQHVKPHEGHQILAQLEEAGLLQSIITQNVSGLHQAAGSKQVIELHGSLKRFRCHECGQKATLEDFLHEKTCSCGGKLRPDLTLFGEALPQHAFRDAIDVLEKTDFLLILGTSLEVYPAAQLPFMFSMTRCYVGLEPIVQQRQMDFVFTTPIGRFLHALKEALRDDPN